MESFVFFEVARRGTIAPLATSLNSLLAMHALYIMGVILVVNWNLIWAVKIIERNAKIKWQMPELSIDVELG